MPEAGSREPASPAADEADPLTAVAVLRARGAQALDPVRFRVIEAMARRAGACEGAARLALEAKLGQRLAAYRQAVQATPRAEEREPELSAAAADAPSTTPARSALASLTDHIGRHARGLAGTGGTGAAAHPGEPDALHYFRRTWSRLSARQRLTQALAAVPDNAGPLNSQHLVHRALALMRDVSPEYLEHFVAHVDALLWLEQANTAPLPVAERKRPGAGKPQA